MFPRWKFVSYEAYLSSALEIEQLPPVIRFNRVKNELNRVKNELEPKTGHWIDADGDNAICGCCNRLNHLYGEYCKHCGAKMVEPQESEDQESEDKE